MKNRLGSVIKIKSNLFITGQRRATVTGPEEDGPQENPLLGKK